VACPPLFPYVHERASTADFLQTTLLAAPLPTVAVDTYMSECEHIGAAAASSGRPRFGADMAFDVGDNAQDLPDLKAGLGSAYGKTPRRLPWPSRTDLKRYGCRTKEREVEKQRDMAGSELEPNRLNKRERRRLQNLHAQRAFRARSKIHRHEVGRCAK
jgi:hypothetical protein